VPTADTSSNFFCFPQTVRPSDTKGIRGDFTQVVATGRFFRWFASSSPWRSDFTGEIPISGDALCSVGWLHLLPPCSSLLNHLLLVCTRSHFLIGCWFRLRLVEIISKGYRRSGGEVCWFFSGIGRMSGGDGEVCWWCMLCAIHSTFVGGHALISFLSFAVRCASCIIKCSELPLLFVPHYGWLGVKYWSWLRQPTI